LYLTSGAHNVPAGHHRLAQGNVVKDITSSVLLKKGCWSWLLIPCHSAQLNLSTAFLLQLKGIPNNLELCKAITGSEAFAAGRTTTGFLTEFTFAPHAAEVVTPGMNTTVQVRPCRTAIHHIH
jgi:hypothetical protein